MENVLNSPRFRHQTIFVPQHWFNAYEHGGPLLYEGRFDSEGMEDHYVRRGDYLVHFAGNSDKRRTIDEWTVMLARLGDVWEGGKLLRDLSGEVDVFWRKMGSSM